MIEVEFKYRIISLDNVLATLKQLGATAVDQHHQDDEYFNHHLDNFKQKDIAFRIRCSDERYFLTYKGPNQDADGKIRHEVEMPLVDEASVAQLREILTGVGFDSVQSVRKVRQTYHLSVEGVPVEICLDEVAGLGAFIEIEAVVDHQPEVAAAKQAILTLASQLGVKDSIRTSYLDLLMQSDESTST